MSKKNRLRSAGFFILLLFAFQCFFLLTSCGSDDPTAVEEEESYDSTTPEGLAALVYEEMTAGSFDCASSYYFGEARINEYYANTGVQSYNICQKLRDDISRLYSPFNTAGIPFHHFTIDKEGLMPHLPEEKPLPYIEGTAYSEDETMQIHFNRLVEHEGQWYVLVLSTSTIELQ